jgi:hypothetical protein
LIDSAVAVCGNFPELVDIEIGGEYSPRAGSMILPKKPRQVCEPIVILQFCPPTPIG